MDAHVYLSDFGVAKTSVTRGLTKANEFVGTIEYVAPEQIAGKPLDGRADIYALGCILFECLSGEVPFDRDSVGEHDVRAPRGAAATPERAERGDAGRARRGDHDRAREVAG